MPETEVGDKSAPGEQKVDASQEKNGSLKPSADYQSGPENQLDPSKVEYVEGKCFYTDPDTGTRLEWNEETKQWSPADVSRNYQVKDGCYFYTDQNTGVEYKWDADGNKWEVVEKPRDTNESEEEDDEDEVPCKKKKITAKQDMTGGVYGMDGDDRTYTDSKDGTVYVWDAQKNAWFPKVDDDFLARYQMSYGFTEESKAQAEAPAPEPTPDPPKPPAPAPPTIKKKPEPIPPTWFDVDEKTNTKVYVSNLPLDITEQEFVDLMQKCGLIMKDVESGKMKVKLYTERNSTTLKGDGLCTYIKVESVQLALNLLDGYNFKGKNIRVERAKFTMKGAAYDPTLKPKKKKKKALEKIKKMQEKLFDWRPDKMRGERGKNEKTIIVKNLFDLSTFDRDPGLILEYQQDLREECAKCGDIRKVIVHDRHPEGVAQIIFKDPEAADACKQLLNGRWFGQRKITAETWDGKTKYKIYETDEEIEARIKKWDSYLEAEEEEREKNEKVRKESGNDVSQAENPQVKDVDSDSDGTRSSAGSGDETE